VCSPTRAWKSRRNEVHGRFASQGLDGAPESVPCGAIRITLHGNVRSAPRSLRFLPVSGMSSSLQRRDSRRNRQRDFAPDSDPACGPDLNVEGAPAPSLCVPRIAYSLGCSIENTCGRARWPGPILAPALAGLANIAVRRFEKVFEAYCVRSAETLLGLDSRARTFHWRVSGGVAEGCVLRLRRRSR